MSNTTSKPRIVTGKVISAKMNKTIVVLVERVVKHPKYGKYIRLCSKMHAHDENQSCTVGNMVKIQETKPISKTKSWKLLEILA